MTGQDTRRRKKVEQLRDEFAKARTDCKRLYKTIITQIRDVVQARIQAVLDKYDMDATTRYSIRTRGGESFSINQAAATTHINDLEDWYKEFTKHTFPPYDYVAGVWSWHLNPDKIKPSIYDQPTDWIKEARKRFDPAQWAEIARAPFDYIAHFSRLTGVDFDGMKLVVQENRVTVDGSVWSALTTRRRLNSGYIAGYGTVVTLAQNYACAAGVYYQESGQLITATCVDGVWTPDVTEFLKYAEKAAPW